MYRLFKALICGLVLSNSIYAQNRLALYTEADSLITLGKYSEVEAISAELIRSDSAEFKSLGFLTLGMRYFHEGKDSVALNYVNASLGVMPNNPVSYYVKGNIYSYRNPLDSSLANYGKAIEYLNESYPKEFISNVFYEYGEIQMFLADYNLALEATKIAIYYDSTDWSNYSQLSDVYLKTDSIDQALKFSNLAMELNQSESKAPNLFKATALYLKGQIDEAIILANTALEDSSQYYSSNFLLADIYANNGNKPLALEYLALCLEHSPNDVFTLNNIAFLNMQTGKYQEAITYFDRCIKLSPDFAFAYNNKAWCLYQMGLHQEALTNCDKSLSLDNANSWAFANRAKIYFALSMNESACSDVKKAESLGYPEKDELNGMLLKCN